MADWAERHQAHLEPSWAVIRVSGRQHYQEELAGGSSVCKARRLRRSADSEAAALGEAPGKGGKWGQRAVRIEGAAAFERVRRPSKHVRHVRLAACTRARRPRVASGASDSGEVVQLMPRRQSASFGWPSCRFLGAELATSPSFAHCRLVLCLARSSEAVGMRVSQHRSKAGAFGSGKSTRLPLSGVLSRESRLARSLELAWLSPSSSGQPATRRLFRIRVLSARCWAGFRERSGLGRGMFPESFRHLSFLKVRAWCGGIAARHSTEHSAHNCSNYMHPSDWPSRHPHPASSHSTRSYPSCEAADCRGAKEGLGCRDFPRRAAPGQCGCSRDRGEHLRHGYYLVVVCHPSWREGGVLEEYSSVASAPDQMAVTCSHGSSHCRVMRENRQDGSGMPHTNSAGSDKIAQICWPHEMLHQSMRECENVTSEHLAISRDSRADVDAFPPTLPTSARKLAK